MYHLRALLIFLPIMNYGSGMLPFSTCPDYLSSMLNHFEVPEFDPDGIFKTATVPICKGDENSFAVQETINGLINGGVFKPVQRLNSTLAPCENNAKIVAEKIGGCLKEKPDCDLSFVVFILTKIQGKMTVVGQGIRQRNCNVLTVYGALQFGDCGLWIQYPNMADLVEVICMTKLQQCSGNILANEIFIVELVVKRNCCIDDFFKEPEFLDYTTFPLIPGYMVKQKNCFSTDYELDFMPVLLEFVPNVAASIVIPNQPNEICLSFQGGVILTEECKIGGIVAAKPTKVSNIVFSLPVTNEIGIQCVHLAGTYCARFLKSIY